MTADDVAQRFWTLPTDRPGRFDAMAGAVYAFQQAANPVYGRFAGGRPWRGVEEAPYLPIEAFKRVPVATFPPAEAAAVFESSGTGRGVPSRHYVRDLALYDRSALHHFAQVFGRGPFRLVAHLPHYAPQSSLVYMVRRLIDTYGAPGSGFFLDDDALLQAACTQSGPPLIVFGAAFGLMDLVEQQAYRLPPGARVVETGGMKTHRRSLDRPTLHARLADGFGVAPAQVWSEYGMAELLSQCYTRGGDGCFRPPPWMHVQVVDPDDPTRRLPKGKPGALAVFDLANVYSVSAVLTQDRAIRRGGGFEVLGRLSHAELRGCNFLLEATP